MTEAAPPAAAPTPTKQAAWEDAPPVLVDGHLDLAYSSFHYGRDLTLALDVLREREQRLEKEAMVTLPELAAGGIGIVFATVFVLPSAHADAPGPWTYDSDEEAHRLAHAQLDLYERWEEEGRARILRTRGDLETQLRQLRELGAGDAASGQGPAVAREGAPPLGIVVLMEGAAPVRRPEELPSWFARGVRILGPAWKSNRYAGGTGEPGPLTAAGGELIDAMSECGLALDVSHMAEEAALAALERHRGSVLSSHANARALVDSDRQLSDPLLRALAARRAVVGLVLADKFLDARARTPGFSVTLEHARRHAEHIAGIVGWAALAVGSDFDGGFGRRETPAELDRAADFHRLGKAVPAAHRRSFLGEAWVSMLRSALPAT